MKIVKRYLFFAVIIAFGMLLKFYILDIDHSQVDEFRGGKLAEDTFNPMIAADFNSSVFTISVDSREYTSKNVAMYMDENRNIMVPVSILREALNCSAHVYQDNVLVVEKYNYSLRFTIGSTTVDVGDDTYTLSSPFVERDGEYYVSLNDLAQLLSYNTTFDYGNRLFSTNDTAENTAALPSRYDMREKGRVSAIRNQGSYGTCWAFAAASALESALLPEENNLFSIDHMTLATSFNINQYDGGAYTMGMAYLAAWQGPVYEADDPYGDGETDESLEAVYHVQEMQVIGGKDYDAIKLAVFKYGGVQTSIYSTIRSYATDDANYRRETSSYCYIGTERPNHDVVIIGWDDNYSRTNFATQPEGDGAFICQNSWGSGFGDNGIFYISYYDTNIGTHNIVYTGIEENDNYDNIYQTDLCGWVGNLGNPNLDIDYIYGANVYTAENDETVMAASFYATDANTSYELYVVPEFNSVDSFTDRIKVASGTLGNAGYYTIEFDTPINVDEGDRYAIILYIQTPGSTHPLAIEYVSDEPAYQSVILDDGDGYISFNGTRFINVRDRQECNICLKAFTNDR